MADTITLAQLKTRSRERANMENSTFVSDTELLDYINSAYSKLYDLLVSRFENYFTISLESAATTVASGATTFSLPADFYKMDGLDFSLGGADYVTVPKFNFKDRNRRLINYVFNDRYIDNRQYRIVADNVQLQPEENASGTYRLWYTPRITRLAIDADTIDAVNGWEEYVVIDAAIMMLNKEESDTTSLQFAKRELEDRIEAMSQNRDSEPETITDSASSYSDYPFRGW